MSLDRLIDAMRAVDGDAGEVAAATRLRVRRALDSRARDHRRVLGVMTAIAVVFGGTVSWALATGEIENPWARKAAPAAPAIEPAPQPAHPHRATAVEPTIAVAPSPSRPVQVPEPGPSQPSKRGTHVERPAKPAAPIEALYRKAHALHFHGADPMAALVAWDAYLAAEPAGRFAVEARYNRAILLVRIGRYAEARAALEPYARGEVEPAGYRQPEAAQLIEKLKKFE